jgi:hypothetical protein
VICYLKVTFTPSCIKISSTLSSSKSVCIICEGNSAVEWIFPSLKAFHGGDVVIEKIFIISTAADKGFAKLILENKYSMPDLMVYFCTKEEFINGYETFARQTTQNCIFLNLTRFETPEWLASVTKSGCLQFDFHLHNMETLLFPMINRTPTVVNLLYKNMDGKTNVINTLVFRTIDHNRTKQFRFVREALLYNLPVFVKEAAESRFRINKPYVSNDFRVSVLNAFVFSFVEIQRSVIKIFSNLFKLQKWNIALVKLPISTFIEYPDHVEAEWMPEEKKLSYAADPFVHNDGNNIKIYFEKYDAEIKRGHIVSSIYNEGFSRPALEFGKHSHLSYPFTLVIDGKKYAVPENADENEVVLYRLEEEWKKVKTLISSFSAVDPTIISYNNKYWLFCTEKKGRGADIRLYIFYADAIDGDWKQHAMNPVKTSIYNSRPAGTPFIWQGKLFRPAQDSSKGYGSRIIINEVTVLTETHFEEYEISSVEPWQIRGQYKSGLHTISAAGNYTVIDARRSFLSFAGVGDFFRKKITPSL